MADLTLDPFKGVSEEDLKEILREESRKMFSPHAPKKEIAFTDFIPSCTLRKIVEKGVVKWRNIVGKKKIETSLFLFDARHDQESPSLKWVSQPE